MKIFNGMNSQVDIPFVGNQRLTVAPRSASENFVGNVDFIKRITTSYTTDEVAIVVAGPYELSLCSNVPVAVNYIVQSIDEAIQKFCINNKKEKVVSEEKELPKKADKEQKPVVEEAKEEKIEEVKTEQINEEPKVEDSTTINEENKPADKVASKNSKRKRTHKLRKEHE